MHSPSAADTNESSSSAVHVGAIRAASRSSPRDTDAPSRVRVAILGVGFLASTPKPIMEGPRPLGDTLHVGRAAMRPFVRPPDGGLVQPVLVAPGLLLLRRSNGG